MLSFAGRHKRHTLQVDPRDLAHANSLKKLSVDELHLLLVQKRIVVEKRRQNFWNCILQHFPPKNNNNNWFTPQLTPSTLQTAYNASEYNNSLFVDHNGNPAVDLGATLACITKVFIKKRLI